MQTLLQRHIEARESRDSAVTPAERAFLLGRQHRAAIERATQFVWAEPDVAIPPHVERLIPLRNDWQPEPLPGYLWFVLGLVTAITGVLILAGL